ncbi:Fe-S cluster assembly protein SufD [Pseudolysobacter antarcticus]|uniref:Fe-S cluster assembly protein SufD n=1 Tax=Pseudolysobacter antarcticus TaxID=2511995 RepID=A0A411HGL1_9GAMM|nr:Fe-S cluster assembly protein SufD [Pseudolysobacter antarcticus]QBB69666.1 Fe-S cluster assembly protein SufD [Pseudolysobacter antarcticus]
MSVFVQSLLDAFAADKTSQPGRGIAWLNAARHDNLQAVAKSGLPTTHNETWKYTALRALDQRAFASRDTQAVQHAIDPAELALPGLDGARLVFVNGSFRADLSRLADLPQGLDVQPLSALLQGDAEPLRFFLGRNFTNNAESFARLNAAFARDGAVVRVAAGAQIMTPLHLVFIGAPAAADIAWHVRNIFELGEGARLDIVEHHLGAATHANLGNVFAEYRLRENATLNLLRMQNEGEQASLIQRSEFSLAKHARLQLNNLDLGTALARHDLRIDLVGDHALASVRGVFVLDKRQHVDNQLSVDHRALNTRCDLFWRGVADGRARGVFNGAITIHAGADGADARLSNKNLLLSAQAEIDTKPVLEIYADEVQASHGATVGQLDESALFYLRSRGLPLAQARVLLIQAFCAQALAQIEPAVLREHVTQLLQARLPQAAHP